MSSRCEFGHGDVTMDVRLGQGSIRGKLVLVALVPIIAILPLGVRSAVDDLAVWNQTSESVQEAARLSDGVAVAQVVRTEWLTTLDLAAVAANDSAAQPMAEIAAEARSDFDQAVQATNDMLDDQNVTSTVFDGREHLHQQLLAGTILPPEIDRTYGRALSQWEQESGNVFIVTTRSDEVAREAATTLRLVNEVDFAVADLRHELTLVIDRLFDTEAGDQSRLAERVDAVVEATRRVDRTSYGSSARWRTLRDALVEIADVEGLAANNVVTGDGMTVADFETVVSSRNALAALTDDIAAERAQLTDVIVAAAEQMRAAAGRSLATSALLLLFAVAVTTFIASKVHRWISQPLLEAVERAQALSAGNLAQVTGQTPQGPSEVRALSAAFDRVTDTVQALEAQALAINAGRLDDPALERKLPGNLGKSLEGTIGRWRETTMQLEHEVAHDPVTDLASLRAIERHADALVENGPIIVAYVALDHFKGVNDAAGRTTGDRVLRRIAQRIKRGASKKAVTARLWGDEFAILLPGDMHDDMDASVERVVRALGDAVTVDGNSWRLTATVGIAEGTQFDRALNDAAVAARYGKRCGGDQVVYHDRAFAALRDKRANVEAQLLTAMANDELEMWFQPVFDLGSNEVTSVEALLRWPDADGSMRLPGEFIPIAEESDLIVSIDRWAINAVCAQLARWRGTPLENLRVAINISGRHLLQDSLASDISDACLRYGITPSLTGVEVTESYLASDVLTVQRNLEELQQLGVELLLDDFGTGYASLAYVRDLPFDTLKIDRSFVETIEDDEYTRSLVGAIVALARELDLSTVAEGVETDQQLAVLQKLGCQSAQGFGLAKPMSAIQLAEFVDGVTNTPTLRAAA